MLHFNKKIILEFQKQILFKMNKMLYKMERVENILYGFEEKITKKFTNEVEESHIQFPLITLSDLNNFEEQLQESQFKNKVVYLPFDYFIFVSDKNCKI